MVFAIVVVISIASGISVIKFSSLSAIGFAAAAPVATMLAFLILFRDAHEVNQFKSKSLSDKQSGT